LYPNPNSGVFTLDMVFNSITRARLRLINVLTNLVVDDRTVQGAFSYNVPYNITSMPAGTYLLNVETPKASFVLKVMKN
jgi:large repetitive protein